MAKKITTIELLGFKHLFQGEQQESKDYFGNLVGKEYIQNVVCDFLSFSRTQTPGVDEFLQEWFAPLDHEYYLKILSNYNEVKQNRGYEIGIFSIESMLRLFLWSLTAPIPEKSGDIVTLDLQKNTLKLYFLFNNDLLVDYQKPAEYMAGAGKNRPLADYILAMNFSQNDLINIDFAQLIYCQFYKAILLLDFMDANQKYWPLLGTLLQVFSCENRQAYIKAIGATVMLPFKSQKHGWTKLDVPYDVNYKKNVDFLEQLAIHDNSILEMNDYLELRSGPLHRISENLFRVTFDLFLVKKVYNGLYFKLGDLHKKNSSLFPEDFAGAFKNEFSEAVLVYHILEEVFSGNEHVRITGNQFKVIKIQTEPDYYVRRGNNVILFESKDVYISGLVKLSYDFPKIEVELRKRLYKQELEGGKIKNGAVLQVVKNVKRVINNEFDAIDANPGREAITIYPVVILHDSLYSAPGLNYLLNTWFNIELEAMKADVNFADFDFERIKPLTIVEIDTLILLAESLKSNIGSFEQLLDQFHEHVRLNFNGPYQSEEEVREHAYKSTLPLSEFARNIFNGDDIKLAIALLVEKFRAYGVQDN